MKRIGILTGTLAVLMLSGLVSIAAANEWDAFYRQHPNHQGEFTNSQAWAGFIVGLRGGEFQVVRLGETIWIRVTQGNPPLFMGERVRMIPFARDGSAEIAELRLPDEDYRPVGVVRYVARNVPREQPPAVAYRGLGSQVGFNFYIERNPGNPYRPPATTYRPPPSFRNGHWTY